MNGAQKRASPTGKLVYNQDQSFNLTAQSAITPQERRLKNRQQIIREALRQTESVSQEQGSTVGQDSTTTVPIEQVTSDIQNITEGQSSDTTVLTADTEQCIRTTPHPLHVISSTSLPPDPIETWPAKQTLDDIPSGMPSPTLPSTTTRDQRA
jgi:hypothetical protein